MIDIAQFNKANVLASIVKEDFFEFVKEFWDVVCAETPIWNWHIRYLCSLLQDLAIKVRRKEQLGYDYLLINIPPGSTKSIIISIMFPAWVWTWWPSASFVGSSHDYKLAVRMSRLNRAIVKSPMYQEAFPDTQIIDDQDTKGEFVNIKKGERMSVGVEGNITGRHGDFVFCDDPLNPKGARSEAELETANQFITETLRSRKKDKLNVPTLIVMQRLHQNDPTGMLLEKFAKDVKLICIPADLTKGNVSPPELVKYYIDGLMDPLRMPKSYLDKERLVGDFYFAGQFLQNPVPLGGGMFKTERINIEESLPKEWTKVVRYWDKACLISDTQITTQYGIKKIKDVKKGDYVLTRNGLNEVKDCWVAKETNSLTSLLLSDNRFITGTSDHKIFSQKRYWIDLQNMIKSDKLIFDNEVIKCQDLKIQSWTQSIFKEEDTQDIKGKALPKEDITIATNGIQKTKETFTEVCIETYGNIITDPYPKVVISTTKTKTGIIITLKTLNVYSRVNIENYTKTNCRLELLSQIQNIVKKHLKLYGVQQQYSKNIIAKIAEQFSMQKVLRLKFACNAGKSVMVYDISVKGKKEFFANGILVHNSTKDGGCYTVGTKLGFNCDGKVWIMDVKRGQWDASAREQIIKQTAEMDGKNVIIGIEQEGGSGGKDSAEATARNLMGFKVRLDKPTGDKGLRADPFATQVNAHNVNMLKAEWNDAYINELAYFPDSTYKDQVDASSGAFKILNQKELIVGVW